MKTYCIAPDGYKTNPRIFDIQSVKSSTIQNVGVYQFAVELMKKHFYESVLDVGCGRGVKLMEMIKPLASKIVGIDTEDVVRKLKKEYPKGNWFAANFEEDTSPFPANFDLILCVDVIEHMEDPDGVMNFIKKTATNSTTIIISTPDRGNFNPNGPPVNKRHVREWTRPELVEYVKESGFKIQQVTKVRNETRKTVVVVCSKPMTEF